MDLSACFCTLKASTSRVLCRLTLHMTRWEVHTGHTIMALLHRHSNHRRTVKFLPCLRHRLIQECIRAAHLRRFPHHLWPSVLTELHRFLLPPRDQSQRPQKTLNYQPPLPHRLSRLRLRRQQVAVTPRPRQRVRARLAMFRSRQRRRKSSRQSCLPSSQIRKAW